MAEDEDKQLALFDSKQVAELAEGVNRQLNINYNVFVQEQNMTTNIQRSNIERLGFGAESEGNLDTPRARTSPPSEKQTYNLDMIGEQHPPDVTWLTPKLTIFNKRPISRQLNSKVYYGRQELLSGQCRDVAIKLIQYNEKNKIEVKTLMKLHHPNIVQIFDAGEFVEKVEHWIYIVMELCSINLEEYIKDNPANTEKALEFSKQIVSAVDFMHKQKIAHRDIKPSNILISKCGTSIKFEDFGISKEIPYNLTSVTVTTYGVGTDGYRPPESYNQNYKVTCRSDIFSLGLVTAYLLSHGKHPFGDDPLDWSYKIRKNLEFNLSQIPSAIPQRRQVIGLIKRMLEHAPSGRPTAKEILRLLASVDVALPQLIQQADQKKTIAILWRNQLHRVNLSNKSLTPMQRLPDDNRIYSAVSIHQAIYIFNGEGNSVFKLKHNDVTAKWVRVRDWPESHGLICPPVVASLDSIFMVGGDSLPEPNKFVSKYNPSMDRWKRLKDMPIATTFSTLLYTKEFLYGIGGRRDIRDEPVRVERMDPKTTEWSRIADLNQPCLGSDAAVEFREKIYVFSTLGDRSTVESWSPKANQWTDIRLQMPVSHRYNIFKNAFDVDGEMYLVTGWEILKYKVGKNELSIVFAIDGRISEFLFEDSVLVNTTI